MILWFSDSCIYYKPVHEDGTRQRLGYFPCNYIKESCFFTEPCACELMSSLRRIRTKPRILVRSTILTFTKYFGRFFRPSAHLGGLYGCNCALAMVVVSVVEEEIPLMGLNSRKRHDSV